MSPEVIRRKLARLLVYLDDLRPHADRDFSDFMSHHYEIERLLELLHESASDLVLHLLKSDHGDVDSVRSGFLKAAEAGLIPAEMADELALACGMRNILVHEYETIDYRIVHSAVPRAIRLYEALAAHLGLPGE